MSSLLATLFHRRASFDSDNEEHHHPEGVQVVRTWPATALGLRRETRVQDAKMLPKMQELKLHTLFRVLLITAPRSSDQHSGVQRYWCFTPVFPPSMRCKPSQLRACSSSIRLTYPSGARRTTHPVGTVSGGAGTRCMLVSWVIGSFCGKGERKSLLLKPEHPKGTRLGMHTVMAS